MIDIRELRVGNYVLAHDPHYEYYEVNKVSRIQQNDDTVSLDGTQKCIIDGKLMENKIFAEGKLIFNWTPYHQSNIFPIPLSGDLLNRCRFHYNNQNKKIVFSDGKMSLLLEDDKLIEINTGVHIKYLHQLQNLYQDQIGEPLNISLSIKE